MPQSVPSDDDDNGDSNLPVVRDQERIERLKEVHEALDAGEMQNSLVPVEAHDVGDDLRANPRASDLGYVEGGGEVEVAANIGGTERVMYDPTDGDARIDCDADTFVDDVSDWA
jgi:hypothetical protein